MMNSTSSDKKRFQMVMTMVVAVPTNRVAASTHYFQRWLLQALFILAVESAGNARDNYSNNYNAC